MFDSIVLWRAHDDGTRFISASGAASGLDSLLARLSQCRERWVLLARDDVRWETATLEALVAHLQQHPDTGAVAPIITDPEGGVLSAGGLLYQDGTISHWAWGRTAWREVTLAPESPFVSLVFVLVRREALGPGDDRELGPALSYGGYWDAAVALLLQTKGFQTCVVPYSAVADAMLWTRPDLGERERFRARWGARIGLQPVYRPGITHQACRRAVPPSTSLVMLCWNNRPISEAAVASLLSAGDAFTELILVDNGSRDDTRTWIAAVAATDSRIRPLYLSINAGFSGGINAGLRCAQGDVLVVLNNDILVVSGWLNRLRSYLTLPGVEGVGPMSNAVSGDQRLAVPDGAEVQAIAQELLVRRAGAYRYTHRLVAFCLAFSRRALEIVGGFDVRFGLGNWEDDDWSQRMQRSAMRLVIAEDVFVGHLGSAGFRLLGEGTYRALMAANQAVFETKWQGTPSLYSALVETLTVDAYLREAERLLAFRGAALALSTLADGLDHFPGDRRLIATQREILDIARALANGGPDHAAAPR